LQANLQSSFPSHTYLLHCWSEYLKALGREHFEQIAPYIPTLESLIFSNSDARISSIFQFLKEM
jgi:hypothetical protein